MRSILFILCCLSLSLSAQDFTLQDKEDAIPKETARLLVVPVHPQYLLSEVDRMLAPDGDVQTIRARLRAGLNRRLTEAFSDSLETLDLLIDDLGSVDRLEFLYNGLDYSYQDFQEDEDEKGRVPWRKKREAGYYGASNHLQDGQIVRDPIQKDRFMAADTADHVMIEYLSSNRPFQHLLVITQLELRRNLRPDKENQSPFVCSVHFSLLDSQGAPMSGGRLDYGLNRSQMDLDQLVDDTFVRVADELSQTLSPYVKPISQEGKNPIPSNEQEDY